MRRPWYVIREALANIRLNGTTTFIAVATTAFTLSCFGICLLLYLNLKDAIGAMEQDIRVVVYLDDDAGAKAASDLEQRLRGEREVATVTVISKEQALDEFRRQFPAEDYLLDGLGDNPLPASLVIGLAPAYRSSAYVKQWAEHLKSFPGVAHVQYSREWLDNVSTLLSYLELAAAAVGIVLSVASVTIIANTIRLTLYARRDEIEIMRLIGATGAFIKVPYVIEGAVLGMLGAVLSIGLLKGMLAFVKLHLGTPGPVLGVQASLGFLPFAVSAGMIGGGLALGCIGSLVSLVELKEVRA